MTATYLASVIYRVVDTLSWGVMNILSPSLLELVSLLCDVTPVTSLHVREAGLG